MVTTEEMCECETLTSFQGMFFFFFSIGAKITLMFYFLCLIYCWKQLNHVTEWFKGRSVGRIEFDFTCSSNCWCSTHDVNTSRLAE